MAVRLLAVLLSVWATGAVIAGEFRQLTVTTSAPANRNVVFAYRLPQGRPVEKIMVVFGGRNWEAERTLKQIDFRPLADRFGLLLVAPGFKDDDYWQPEKWSGRALKNALAQLEKEYALHSPPLIYYGYSAGGQCANLFYLHDPRRVMAWGVHACGVWGDPVKVKPPVPVLITCGGDDCERLELSRNFVQRCGDAGWLRLWAALPGGHELSPDALKLANLFFTAILIPEKEVYYGDDQIGRIEAAGKIDPELRSYLPGRDLRDRWQRLMER
jgi:poly(3-hydroxybutyrate) depolymerase